MKRNEIKILLCSALVFGLVLMGSNVFAYSVNIGDTIRFINLPGYLGGGEFGVAKLPDVNTQLFVTFCVQRQEHADYNEEGFLVYDISKDVKIAGGGTLSYKTAYLYYKFATGTLLDNTNTLYVSDDSHANSLSQAIWYFEGEPTGTLSQQAQDWINEANDPNLDTSGYLNSVSVLNLRWATSRSGYAKGAEAQDVLILVPEPGTMLLLGTGLLGLAIAARRRKK